jgi:hypothetical protein
MINKAMQNVSGGRAKIKVKQIEEQMKLLSEDSSESDSGYEEESA